LTQTHRLVRLHLKNLLGGERRREMRITPGRADIGVPRQGLHNDRIPYGPKTRLRDFSMNSVQLKRFVVQIKNHRVQMAFKPFLK